MHEITTALRALRHRPGFAVVAVLTLALGIGANTAIFAVIDVVLLRPLPFANADRLAIVWGYSAEVQQRTGFDRLPWSPGDLDDFITRNTTFERLVWVRADRVNLTGTDEPERLGAVRVSRAFFETLGVQAVFGRTFDDSDAHGGRTVVIAETLWRRRFNSNPEILTAPISLNGEPAAVVGVLPSWFRFPRAGDLPQGLGYTHDPEIWTLDVLSPQVQRTRAGKSFSLIGRMRDGVGIDAAGADLGTIAAAIAREFPSSNAGWTARVMPLREQLVGSIRPALLVLMSAVGVLLLVACANVANLLLVRASARQREVCVRRALGVARGRLVRQLLVESVVLGAAAGLVGIVLAWWSLSLLLTMLPAEVPALSGAGLHGRAVLFTALVSIATGVIFGIGPAIQATRLDVADGLREGSRGSVGNRKVRRTRNALVVAEVAAAVVLLIAATLLLQTFVRLMRVDHGFRSAGVLTAEVALAPSQYRGERVALFFESVMERLAAVPGIRSVAVTSALPLVGLENLRQVTIEGRPRPNPGEEIISDYRVVSPAYFRVMGIPQLAGEPLPISVGPEAAPVLLISRRMAETAFRGADPIGRRMKLTSVDQPGPWFTVIGVVGDTRHTALDTTMRPQVYVHLRFDPHQQMAVVLETGAGPSGYASIIRRMVSGLDRNQPVGRIRTMETIVAEAAGRQRFTMALVAVFAGLALVFALVGLYAVVSHSVAERVREMGVRLALGASPAGLLRLVLFESLRLVGAGVAIGIGLALGAMQFLSALLFGVSAHDPATFLAIPLVLFAAATLGCLVPARRAMRVDPMVTLRAD